jgi:PPOX class probable F420-dependent enzyme
VSGLPGELRSLIASGPMAHLTTVNPDGSPQVTVIWIGLDGDELVSGHMNWYAKLRNIARDPRVVLSFDAPREPGSPAETNRRRPEPRGRSSPAWP